jgi:hypothetical protein
MPERSFPITSSREFRTHRCAQRQERHPADALISVAPHHLFIPSRRVYFPHPDDRPDARTERCVQQDSRTSDSKNHKGPSQSPNEIQRYRQRENHEGRQRTLGNSLRSRQLVHAHSLQIKNCFSVRLRAKLSAPPARAGPPVVFSQTRRGSPRRARYLRRHSLFRGRSRRRCRRLPE